MMESDALGKKVFFLYPPPVLDEIVEELARREYEVYLTRNHKRLARYLAQTRNAILFFNLDEELSNDSWWDYIKSLRDTAPDVGIGVITLNESDELRERYLMELQVQCGFIVVKIGAAQTSEILDRTLEANEARGRRKFVRARCAPGTALMSVEYAESTLRAELTDLSSAGMALQFQCGMNLKVGTVLRDFSLTIKGQRIFGSGVVVAKRDDGSTPVHVIMFDPSSLDETRRDKLKTTVFRINQAAMDLVLERA
jgi:hypothetical protein